MKYNFLFPLNLHHSYKCYCGFVLTNFATNSLCLIFWLQSWLMHHFEHVFQRHKNKWRLFKYYKTEFFVNYCKIFLNRVMLQSKIPDILCILSLVQEFEQGLQPESSPEPKYRLRRISSALFWQVTSSEVSSFPIFMDLCWSVLDKEIITSFNGVAAPGVLSLQ